MTIGYRETDSRVFTQAVIFRGGGVLVLSYILPSVRPSVRLFICTHISARFPLDGSPWNLILGNFMKMLRENTSLVKIEKNVGKMREGTNIFLSLILFV